MMFMAAIRQRPASSERNSRSIRRPEEPVNRSTCAAPAPMVLLSWMPLIDRLSSMITFSSASSR